MLRVEEIRVAKLHSAFVLLLLASCLPATVQRLMIFCWIPAVSRTTGWCRFGSPARRPRLNGHRGRLRAMARLHQRCARLHSDTITFMSREYKC